MHAATNLRHEFNFSSLATIQPKRYSLKLLCNSGDFKQKNPVGYLVIKMLKNLVLSSMKW